MQRDEDVFSKMKPIDPALFTELHKKIGLALWHGQDFENSLVRYIALILKLPQSRAESEMREILEKLQKQTLGPLINELSKANSSTSITSFDVRMDAYLEHRNWLVHRSWREHHTDLFSPEKLPQLFERLDFIANESVSLRTYFSGLVYRWTLQQPGITQADIDADVDRRLRNDGVIE